MLFGFAIKVKQMSTKNSVPTPAEIAAEFLDERGWSKKTPLDSERVRAWLGSDDLEVLGAANRLLFTREHWPRVTPSLSFEKYFRFRKHYYERCLTELTSDDYEGEWADVGFDLTHSIVYWFQELIVDKSVPRHYLEDLKVWLRRMILQSAQGDLLASAVIDHLLQWKKTAKFFADWPEDFPLSRIK